MISRKQIILFFGNVVTTITMFGVPWSRQIRTLTIWMVVNGLTLGVLDTGGNVCCLNLWGKDSGPFYQALHFTFGIGGLVSPLIAAPFLGDYSDFEQFYDNGTLETNETCYQNHTDFSNATSVAIPRVTWAYMSIGVISFFVTILFLAMCIIAPVDESGRKGGESESGKKSWAFTALIVFLTCILILTSMGTEVGYAQMLTTYAVKGPLHLSTSTGSYMTSTYWAAFTASRLAAIFLTIKFSNFSLIVFDVVLTFIGGLVLLFLAASYDWALWVASILLGVGIASFFPASVSWIEQYINVTNKIASMFAVGASFGEMIIPYTISYFIDEKPEVFIYVVIVSCVVAIVVTFIMYLILRKIPDKYTSRRTSSVNAARSGSVNAAYNNTEI
ncbi:sodium-dependent glucose transporter 1 isoform X2 [Parasteatoda tepidariorum]|nr:sodium-dependent glucose transporter 1-like isoform X2 [Parasteatoda tepidariorum]